MEPSQPAAGLEISEDPAFQRRMILAERWGRVGMGLVIAAALVGAFGRGAVSQTSSGEAESLRADFDRFERLQNPGEVQLRGAAKAARRGEIRIHVTQPYLDSVLIERTDPVAEETRMTSDGREYIFPAADLTAATLIRFYVRPQKVGWISGQVRAGAGEAVDLFHFVYP